MRRAFALGATIALLLQIAENIFPHADTLLPLHENGFVQTAAIILGAVALNQVYEHFNGSDDDGDQDNADPKE